ncbi:MAG: CopD family protein [Gemmatimonadaceae bacterium]
MGWLYFTNVAIHVLAATVWIGGNLFLALVGAPVLRTVEPSALRTQLFNAIGMRFRYVGWASVVVLLVTGVVALWQRGWLRRELLLNPPFWSTPTGMALGWKLAGVAVMLVLSAMHDLLLSPDRARTLDSTPGGSRVRRRLILLARAGTLVAVLVVGAAVRLARS